MGQLQQYLELLQHGACAAIIAAMGVGVIILQLWHITGRLARIEGALGTSEEISYNPSGEISNPTRSRKSC